MKDFEISAFETFVLSFKLSLDFFSFCDNLSFESSSLKLLGILTQSGNKNHPSTLIFSSKTNY